MAPWLCASISIRPQIRRLLLLAVAVAAASALAEPSGDRPDASHAWAVHDVNRPDPVKVEVPVGGLLEKALEAYKAPPKPTAPNLRDF